MGVLYICMCTTIYDHYTIKRKNNFLILLDKKIDNSKINFLVKSIHKRYVEMSKIFAEFSKNNDDKKYTKYIINWSKDGKISGKCYTDILICTISDQSFISEMPMIHEEAHLVVYNSWGVLPLFWAEGLSEYLVLKYKNNLDNYLIENIIDNIVELDEKKVSDLFCYYSDNMFNYWRRCGYIYSLTACSLFEFIIKEYGMNFLNNCVLFIQNGKNRELENLFKESEIFCKWKKHINNIKIDKRGKSL